ncbi:hypothetical protein ACIRRA_36790 [Nocardia sp. NPDC101769]|uniref:hypothetical protein n=1 Tax=Nocardia sp. NPDC101769 TaxID=3364333 RepID=UPI003802BF82
MLRRMCWDGLPKTATNGDAPAPIEDYLAAGSAQLWQRALVGARLTAALYSAAD